MFIELAEFLACPQDHEATYCVVVPLEMVGRSVMHGTVGCPICKREFPIRDGVVRFGELPERSQIAARETSPDPEAVRALLGLSNPGGYVVLVGSATRLAMDLARLMGGIHFVGVNPPSGVEASPFLSLLIDDSKIPLRSSFARGVVLGLEYAAEPWLSEGVRVLLRGLRLVALSERLTVAGVQRLAQGQGIWVGQKG